jgi:rare lipoprotein A
MKKTMIASLGTAMLLTGCGGGGSVSRSLDTAPPAVAGSVADYPVKLGEPYVMEGITYTPSDAYNYDEAGYASWYGQELSGRSTSNGEPFDPEAITGAHRTLPLPSYVEVTALDTGKTILVRLNDRGPSSPSRLIDLSYGAAKQLGVVEKGSFPVRVRRVNPPEAERAMLRAGRPVAMRMETPESLLVPLRRKLDGKIKPAVANQAAAAPAAKATKPGKADKPVAMPRPPRQAPVAQAPRPQGNDRFIVEGQGSRPASTGSSARVDVPRPAPTAAPAPAVAASYFVQVAAFSSKARADELARRIGANAHASGDGKVFRVRYGPYADAQAAQQGLTLAKRNGYQGARIQQDFGR